MKTFKFKSRIEKQSDLRMLFHGKKKSLIHHLNQELAAKRRIKWFVSVKFKFIKPKVDGSDLVSEPHFGSLCITTVIVEEQLNEANRKIFSAFTTYEVEG